MADEPFAERRDLDAKREAEKRNLVKAYKSTFGSAHGMMVLADLKHAFGFDKWEAIDTDDADKIARRVCAKGPIFHIEKMRNTSLEKKAKPKAAISEPAQ